MKSDPERPGEAASRMLELLNAHLTVQALHVAAALGVPDRLADGPATADTLAAEVGAHAPSLHRLMRMLVGSGVFHEDPDGRFVLTPLGATLRSEGAGSVRDWALYVGAPAIWQALQRLGDTVRTGEPSFVLAHGMPVYEYMAEHPALGGVFDRWMTQQSDAHNAAIVSAYDFSPFHTVADIGGGQGSTLAAILRGNPTQRGILFDVPKVVAHTAPLAAAGVADRCDVVGGDMMEALPAGADAYVIKRVLMIFGDEQAIRVLRHCADVLPTSGRVLVIDMVMPSLNEPSQARVFDLLMMVNNPGGGIRTEAEFRALFAAAGLRLTNVIATTSPNSVLEGVLA
jgi:precorrin-6B methylase 2